MTSLCVNLHQRLRDQIVISRIRYQIWATSIIHKHEKYSSDIITYLLVISCSNTQTF
ncbi:hypothetical protein GIB67_035151 [Kingdonia uniflora]|uniref:Uncharacterized protein n=1 Tax=Kingdonia uniflora TaxID=39325 RepID=A0A7J7LDX5_9MAGN|nr:hypothetical protein GIB67_035151 [Kingdonia uniflora]